MPNYQKLEEPQIIEIDSHLCFVVATEIDLTQLKNGLVSFRGKSYEYEDGEVVEGNIMTVNNSLVHEGYLEFDKNGKCLS